MTKRPRSYSSLICWRSPKSLRLLTTFTMVSLYLQSPKYEGGSLTNSGFGQLGCGLEINYEKPIQNSDHTHVTVKRKFLMNLTWVPPSSIVCPAWSSLGWQSRPSSYWRSSGHLCGTCKSWSQCGSTFSQIHDLGGMGKWRHSFSYSWTNIKVFINLHNY